MDINNLKSVRADALKRAQAVAEAAEKENRNLTDDERATYESAMTEARNVAERIERAAEMDAAQGLYPAEAPNPNIGMDKKEVRRYSILRAINAHASGDWSKAGFERECSEAVEAQVGKEPRGFYVPSDYLEQRTYTVGSDTAFLGTDHMAGSFIDLLRNRMVVKAAGATVLDGLVGNVAIPKASTGTTAYWVAESGAATESAYDGSQVTLTPKAVTAYQDLSRKALIQTSPSVDQLVMADLAKTIAIAIDLAALHGTGLNNQPTGIAATSGIGSVAGGTNGAVPAWDDIVGLETEVAQDNADINSMAYITNAKIRGLLKQTVRVASTDSRFIWAEGGQPLNGYPCYVTNQVSSTLTKGTSTEVCSAIFFGDWSQLLIGMWGGLDLLVDPYSLSTKGALRLVAFQDCDIAVRYAQSFAAMLDAKLS